jgi:uncharacterized protein (DUF779 family)
VIRAPRDLSAVPRMPTIRITPRAAEFVARVRAERQGTLTFTIDGGCCEGTAPHLFEDAVLVGVDPVGEAAGVPVYLQAAMTTLYADADVTIDVIDEAMSDAMSLETEYGVRFVLREGAVCAR